MSWLETDVQTLRELYLSGVSYQKAAARLGRSIQSVEKKCQELGIALNYSQEWSSEEISIMLKLSQQGKTAEMIAEAIPRSASSIRQEAKKLGIKLKRASPRQHWGSWTEDDDSRLRELHELGYSTEYIAHELGRTANAVAARKSLLGLRFRKCRQPA